MSFFDPNTVDDTGEFDLLPAGRYRVMIDSAAVKANRSNPGRHVSVAMTVVEGPLKGRKVWSNFNIEHSSEKAQQIGRSQFKRFLAACGITEALESPMDVVKVQHKVVGIELQHRQGSDGQTRAEVKQYTGEGETAAPQGKPAAAPKKAPAKKAAPANEDADDIEVPF